MDIKCIHSVEADHLGDFVGYYESDAGHKLRIQIKLTDNVHVSYGKIELWNMRKGEFRLIERLEDNHIRNGHSLRIRGQVSTAARVKVEAHLLETAKWVLE